MLYTLSPMYMVVFESWRDETHDERYADYAQKMLALASDMPGFVAFEHFTSSDDTGKALSLSVWESEEAIKAWREHAEHRVAQALGQTDFYRAYRLRVAKIERDYGYER